MCQASQEAKASAHTVMHMRVTRTLVIGHREEEMGEKGEKVGSKGGGCGPAGSPTPGGVGNTGLSLLSPLCSQDPGFSSRHQGELIHAEG